MAPDIDHYIVFRRQGYDRMYYGVAGKDTSYADAVLFLTEKEAYDYVKEKTLNESRSTGKRQNSP
jgi:hypothetical protein